MLGVAKSATQDEIKKAYRKLVMEHHPDKGGDVAMFTQIQEAYDTLGNPEKRTQYDTPSPNFNNFSGHPGGFSFQDGHFDINEIFNQIFGQNRQQFRQQVFRTQVHISLVDAFNGLNHTIQLATPTGNKIINIKIPKGIDTGDQIRYDNVLDNASLMVEFIVSKDLRFDRNRQDLHSNQPISVLDLIVGADIEFTTIGGRKLSVNIPAGTQPSQQIKISGHGMPIAETGMYGDQLLLLKPYIPDNVTQDIVDAIHKSKNS